MPIILKKSEIKIKDRTSGEYTRSINVVAERTTASEIEDIQAEGDIQVAAVQAASDAAQSILPTGTTLADLAKNSAAEYSSTATYAVGDYCVHDYKLYQCIVVIGSGGETWDDSHWILCSITPEINNLKTALFVSSMHDFDIDSLSQFTIGPNGTWIYTTSLPSRSSSYSVKGIKKVRVTNNASVNTIIAFLKTYNPVDGESADFSDSFPSRISLSPGESREYFIENDVNYLYSLRVNTSSNNCTPTILDTYLSFGPAFLSSVDEETSDETGKIDRTDDIELILNRYGYCQLSSGIFYVRGNIQMPEGSLLIGSGQSTIVKLLDSVTSASTIIMNRLCTIKDLTLQGSYTSISPSSSPGTRNGIEWTGSDMLHGTIDNCQIWRFTGSGIYLHDTTTDTYRNLTISNCYISRNHVGIDIYKDSEFHKISNCTIRMNYYGYRNRGGNNVVSNCGIDSNIIGIQIDNSIGSNGGHGIISNCSINHSDGNSGYGLIIQGTGRMLVDTCNFYYSKIKLNATNGNIISDCGFGDSGIEIIDGECSVFNGCMFKDSTIPITVTRNTAAKMVNCYTRAGDVVSLPT